MKKNMNTNMGMNTTMSNYNLMIDIPNITQIIIHDCEQKLFPNDKYVGFAYDINQKLSITGDLYRKKFLSEIVFFDAEINKNIWIGSFVNVACIAELTENFVLENKKILLSRNPVIKSLKIFDENNQRIQFKLNGNEVSFDEGVKKNARLKVRYRPWLQMYVKNFVTKCRNFGFDIEQKISLEEV